jgi:2-dehydro-3-deoxygluconokinase
VIVGFGEVMLRLATEGRLRLRQAVPGRLEATFGGGEANVCVSLAQLGRPSRFVTALPATPLTESLLAQLRGFGVDTSRVVAAPRGRLGIYFLETGANQRASVVVYDRDASAIALLGPDDYDFHGALEGATWVHVTGITPALSRSAFLATKRLVERARAAGLPVSCDLNFRKKLWQWEPGVAPRELAGRCMAEILAHATVAIGNEEDAHDVLGICAAGTAVDEGRIDAAAYVQVAAAIHARFPQLGHVAITLRESRSADDNGWGGMLFEAASGRAFFAPLDAQGRYAPYAIRDIVDRVGGGDAFAAGLIFALTSEKYRAPPDAVKFAAAASCLKHSIPGDYNVAGESEVAALMAGAGSGRVQR